MQNNNFRGFSSNNRYNQNSGNFGGFQNTFNQFNYPRNQNSNNLLFSNNNNTNNILTFNNSQQNNNNFPVRINPISSFQMGNNNSLNPQQRANSQKKHLYVKLTQEEKGYYSNLFQLVDGDNIGKLKAKDAANFMKKSGLSKEVLKNIYLIASQSSKQFLERDEFYVALRLIALAQNNMPYNAQSIILNRPIPPLPNFNLKKDYLADDDNLFDMRDDEKVKYKRLFDINKDGNNDNISARKAILMWRSTGASDSIIKRIADILRPNETKGYLNLREFQVATHLINLSDKHEIPTQLPTNLRKYLGRPEIANNNSNNINIMNLNLNLSNNNNIGNNNGVMNNNIGNNNIANNNINSSVNNNASNNNYNNIMNFDFGNNNNNANNCQQIAISYPKFNFGNTNNNNFGNINNNNFGNNINSNNPNPNDLQGTMRVIEELNQKNELLNNQINMAKNRLNDVIREIDNLQNEQQNIRNQINLMKQKCSSLMPNIGGINNNINNINNDIKLSTNNNINNFPNNNINNIPNNNINIDSNINPNQNNFNSNSATKTINMSLNQSGIGPSKSIIGFNLPQQQQNQNSIEKDSRREEYERLARQRQNLMDLMNKMQFDKLIINNEPNANTNNNNNLEQNEEIKNNNKDKDIADIPPEKDISQKNLSPLPDSDSSKNINNKGNKFDDRLLESQAFTPEKLTAALEIPNPGDEFNFGDEVVNPYEDENENANTGDNKKKDEFNFGPSSPIGNDNNNQFNFDRQSNLSLGSEIKKIDEDNNENKFKANDSNVFNVDFSDSNRKPERKDSKDTFNFNTMDNQKDADEWDF